MRKAFTLMELMVASAIVVTVFAGAGAAFVGVIRLSKTAVAEAELSIRMRELREKLLFHSTAPDGGNIWSGLLSGGVLSSRSGVVQSSDEVLADAGGYRMSGGGPRGAKVNQRIDLVRKAGDGFFTDASGLPNSASSWLSPAGIPMLPARGDEFGAVVASVVQEQRGLYTVYLKASSPDDENVVRIERVVIPIFGKVQVRNNGNVFHD